MVSNAFSMLQNLPPTVNLLSTASNISFISLKEAFSVELFLKPYCLFANILFCIIVGGSVMNFVILWFEVR
jgi:hypothetical protein